MQVLSVAIPQKGIRLGRVIDGQVVGVHVEGYADGRHALLECLRRADTERTTLAEILEQCTPDTAPIGTLDALNVPPSADRPYLVKPYEPPEVWAFGVTYKRSAEWRSNDTSVSQRIYDHVYKAARPELFYKGYGHRIVGPNEPVCIRSDSKFSATEPELAYVLGSRENILAYTICNDFSAWDIERENPLYLPQSKIFTGCCAFGPVLITPDELTDPYNLDITLSIHRDGVEIFNDTVNSSQIGRKFETLNTYLTRNNPVPVGTLVSTGTGIIMTAESAHADGDQVAITISGIGVLYNPVKQL